MTDLRHRAERLHHAQHVQLAPALGDLAIHDAVDADRGDANELAARGNAIERVALRAVPRIANRHELALDDDVVDAHVAVREGRAPRLDQIDQALRPHADRLTARAMHCELTTCAAAGRR